MEHWDAVERSGHGMGSIVVSEDMELLIEFNADATWLCAVIF